MLIEKDISFNQNGPIFNLKIQLDYKELKVFEFPKNCSSCPVGFSCNSDCGRNIPFQPTDYISRPKTCKLQKITLSDLGALL